MKKFLKKGIAVASCVLMFGTAMPQVVMADQITDPAASYIVI